MVIRMRQENNYAAATLFDVGVLYLEQCSSVSYTPAIMKTWILYHS